MGMRGTMIGFGLVWERVSHDSVDFAVAMLLTILPTVYIVLLDIGLLCVILFDQRLHYSSWPYSC